jgi:hypothetical protein
MSNLTLSEKWGTYNYHNIISLYLYIQIIHYIF